VSVVLKLLSVLALFLAGAVALSLLFILEGAPAVQDRGAPTPEDVVLARTFVRDLRSAAEVGADTPFVASASQLDSVLRLGARLIPGFRGQLAVEGGTVIIDTAIPVPLPGIARWLNLSATVPEFDGDVVLERVAVGPVSLPPNLALELGRVGGNMVLGDGFGDTAMTAATAMRIDDDVVTFDLEIEELGKNGIMRGVFGALRGNEMPSADLIGRYDVLIGEAMERGDLPAEGSYLPYLVFTLEAALEGSQSEGASDAYTAAIFALTRICGARDFTLLVGSLAGLDEEEPRIWGTDCDALTLNGRIDSRRHFTTSAALQAASNRGVAITVGEFKELYDTVKSGGFDFTDIAANNSGIRLSNLFMATPTEAWPDLIARIQSEGDVIIPFDDVPQILTEEEFVARFGSTESADYAAMLDRIEGRIDGLRLHATP